ncbi:hypothetical protein ABZX12_13705 [Kribbella sp. NPDC003505]|uniref:hypothetical protein n=1 Tax=Kribbella sp. NPDC003505 TaxID=3154448 RepID=UPI0033A01468
MPAGNAVGSWAEAGVQLGDGTARVGDTVGGRLGVGTGRRVGVAVGGGVGVAIARRVGVATGPRVGVADGGSEGVGTGRQVGIAVGGRVGGTGRADGARVGVATALGVARDAGCCDVDRVGVAAGPPWAAASAVEPPLRAIAVPATATPTTAADAIAPTSTRVVRRFRPASFIVALRT